MNAGPAITVTPVHVADLVAGGERTRRCVTGWPRILS